MFLVLAKGKFLGGSGIETCLKFCIIRKQIHFILVWLQQWNKFLVTTKSFKIVKCQSSSNPATVLGPLPHPPKKGSKENFRLGAYWRWWIELENWEKNGKFFLRPPQVLKLEIWQARFDFKGNAEWVQTNVQNYRLHIFKTRLQL